MGTYYLEIIYNNGCENAVRKFIKLFVLCFAKQQ